jgi:hypothetical protein
MIRIAGVVAAISAGAMSAGAMQAADADEIRHTTFPGSLIGSWAQSADLCTKDNKSNFAITASSYTGPDGSCAVEIIVETAAPDGANYSVRGTCKATPQDQPRVVNVIMRLKGADGVAVGTSFEDLKPYQRCPAKP